MAIKHLVCDFYSSYCGFFHHNLCWEATNWMGFSHVCWIYVSNRDEIIRKFGPKIYVEGSEREWKTALVRTAAALPPEADMSNCISDYIDFLRSRCNLYGSSWYYVQVCWLCIHISITTKVGWQMLGILCSKRLIQGCHMRCLFASTLQVSTLWKLRQRLVFNF